MQIVEPAAALYPVGDLPDSMKYSTIAPRRADAIQVSDGVDRIADSSIDGDIIRDRAEIFQYLVHPGAKVLGIINTRSARIVCLERELDRSVPLQRRPFAGWRFFDRVGWASAADGNRYGICR